MEAATSDATTIRAWWTGLYRGHGVGITLGQITEGRWLFAVDIDTHDNVDGEQAWHDLVASHHPQPGNTVEAVTGGGGRHLLFWSPTEIRNGRIAPGVDIRGAGGQIVVEPTIHPSGEPYTWVDGQGIGQTKILEAPRWLVASATRPNPEPTEQSPTPPRDRPGDLWAAQTTWNTLLERDGWTLHHTDPDGEQHWTRPGKEHREGTSATVGYHGSNVLKVFTSSIPALTPDATYSKLGYLAATRYGGDHSAAASALRQKGFKAPDIDLDELIGDMGDQNRSDRPPPNLPPTFWQERPELAQIHTAAHTRALSADAVLAGVLARLSALTPPSLRLPAPVGTAGTLDVAVALIGASGTGKSSGVRVSAELLPIDDPSVAIVPLGSGEGLIEAYLDYAEEIGDDGKTRKTKQQTKRAVLALLDEGQALAEMGGRNGSTLLPTIRSAWSGDRLGQANATEERKRNIAPGAYRFALIAGFQTQHAATLIDDAPGGTPQRFTYFAAEDPTIPDEPPDWPGPLPLKLPPHQAGPMPLDATVTTEIRNRALARSRGEVTIDPLDSHRDLSRLKMAGLLAVLNGRTRIDVDDWRLAGDVLDASDRVRAGIIAAARARAIDIEQSATSKAVKRAAAMDDDAGGRAVAAMARAIARHVRRGTCNGPCGRRCSARSTSGKHRQLATVEDAIDEALSHGWIILDGDAIRPGQDTP